MSRPANGDHIHVDDLVSTITVYHPEIKKAVIDFCNCMANVKSDVDSTKATVESIDAILKGSVRTFNTDFSSALQRYNSIHTETSPSISKAAKLNTDLGTLDSPDDLVNSTNSVCDLLAISSVTITACVNYCTNFLSMYNSGQITHVDDLYQIDWLTPDEWINGAASTFAAALSELDNPLAAGASFLLSSFASRQDEGADKYGGWASSFTSELNEVLPLDISKFWVNVGIGTCAYVILSALENFGSDEGIMTGEDVIRYSGYTL